MAAGNILALQTLADIEHRLNDPLPFIRRIFDDLFLLLLAELRQPLKRNTPPWNPGKPGGGTLPQEWRSQITKFTPLVSVARVYHPRALNDEEWTKILHFLNYGTKAHGPVTAQALHWVENGQDIFRKWVRGIVPSHFAERADKVAIKYSRTLHWKWKRWLNTGMLP